MMQSIPKPFRSTHCSVKLGICFNLLSGQTIYFLYFIAFLYSKISVTGLTPAEVQKNGQNGRTIFGREIRGKKRSHRFQNIYNKKMLIS